MKMFMKVDRSGEKDRPLPHQHKLLHKLWSVQHVHGAMDQAIQLAVVGICCIGRLHVGVMHRREAHTAVHIHDARHEASRNARRDLLQDIEDGGLAHAIHLYQ